ncbi:MAG: DHH family phosphoesterase [bacterium]|nr:DHH family phosphoesterase [bacterium]
MALNLNQQIIDSVGRANHILLTAPAISSALPTSPALDGLSAGLGLGLFLERLGKKTDLVIKGFETAPHLAFLPKVNDIKPCLQGLQKFVIKLDVGQTKVSEMKYDLKDNELRIFITPEHGIFKTEDVKTHGENFKYDLIITLDTPDLESLGEIFEKNSDLFFNTPVINIDHKSDNEHFGAINAVDMTSSATSEVVYNHLENWDRRLIDEATATCLLTGLIAKTQSFQNIKSPRTFQTAGRLVALGAEREKIMQNLYRNLTLSTFRLWGVTLANLKHDAELKFAWSVLTARDFLSTGGKEEELPGVAENLILNSKETDVFLILYERSGLSANGEICGLLFSPKIKGDFLLGLPWPSENRFGFRRFCLAQKSLLDAEKEMVDVLKKKLYTISTRN